MSSENISSNDVLYEGKQWDSTRLRITQTILEIGIKEYPIESIKRFTEPGREGLKLGALIGGIIISILGLLCVLSLEIGWIIVGLILLLVGGLNIWMAFDRKYFTIIFFDNGEEYEYIELSIQKKDDMIKFWFSLMSAVISAAQRDNTAIDRDFFDDIIRRV